MTGLNSSGLAALGLVVIASAAAGVGPSAGPQPAIITTNYYVFGGTNSSQMRAAMIEARPWKETMVYDAHTKWDIQSNYRFSRTNDQFKLLSAEVKTKVSITLPQWIPGKPVSRDLVAKWQRCFTGLSVHEQGHLQLALAAGAEVRRRLDELPLFASPQELTAAASRLLNDTIAEYQQRERKYDEVTGHGRTQGAVFPVEVRTEPDLAASSTPTNGFPRRQSMRRR